jgi:hypothetical protein
MNRVDHFPAFLLNQGQATDSIHAVHSTLLSISFDLGSKLSAADTKDRQMRILTLRGQRGKQSCSKLWQ